MSKNVIYVGPAGDNNAKPQKLEGIAAAAIAPGTLLKTTATGFDANDQAATQFGAKKLWADKDQLRSRLVTDNWTINETMQAIDARSGEFLNVRVAAGQDITRVGTPLSSNADGTLKIAVTPGTVGATSEEILAYSDEIIDTTGGEALVRVRIA